MLISTGGTARRCATPASLSTDVSAVTGFPEIMDGRVKTLHPKIHGGLLALRDKPDHAEAMRTHGIEGIDLLVSNLYPFEATVASGADFDETIENIDIGGPAMIRAAAKNHDWVTVVVDPEDYAAGAGRTAGPSRAQPRRRCAASSRRSPMRARPLMTPPSPTGSPANSPKAGDSEPAAPARVRRPAAPEIALRREPASGSRVLRHGRKALRRRDARSNCRARSFRTTTSTTPMPLMNWSRSSIPKASAACAIIKHANPCGVALGAHLVEAYRKALACDPVSAFGGVLAFNRTLDGATAEEIAKLFTEVIIAPDADDDARRILSSRRNLRLLIAGGLPDPHAGGLTFRTVAGGFLVQTRDNAHVAARRSQDRDQTATQREPKSPTCCSPSPSASM